MQARREQSSAVKNATETQSSCEPPSAQDTNVAVFKGPAIITMVGATGTGKSTLLMKLLNQSDTLFQPPPSKIFWCYGVETADLQKLNENPKIELIEGLPDLQQLTANDRENHKIVVLDDLGEELAAKKDSSAIFTRYAHHNNFTVIQLLQNLYQNKDRTARANSTYIILLATPSDSLQTSSLARQLFPNNPKYLTEAMEDVRATHGAYSYLIIDNHPQSCPNHRLLTDVVDSDFITVYVPK
ncbi:hypothetical protein L596_021158 [Steinernema carpocapsae]|uniref:AAA+ ATPase domain-containing protein n=1 Tax=Steinernema carpocapsae TaxID=34508 RepID=A0A4U5MWS7_STECR|nr:hypothetical protein L596_021158 [Steinernema carpocapsae]